jgi:hypothetical protein
VCKPDLYLPFNDNNVIRDYSGNKREVINHGVKLTNKGYAYFDGKSYLEISKFLNLTKESEITIAVRFLETKKSGRLRAIISNSISKQQPSLLILNSAKNVHTMIKKEDTGVSTLHTVMRVSRYTARVLILAVF